MYILQGEKCELGFICHPKTGSQSVRVAMRELKAEEVRGHHRVDADECARIRGSGGIVACVVRNPYDLMVSWYFYSHYNVNNKCNKPILPFDEWLDAILCGKDDKDTGVNGTRRWFADGMFYGFPHSNRILRFERLQAEFSQVLLDSGIPEYILGVYGKSNDLETYRGMYSKTSQARVAKTFANELMQFGYSF